MGLFNFKFGDSKKEQDKSIRDRLKGRKHFEKVLDKRLIEINEDKMTIANGCNNLFINRVIADNSIDVIFVKYSMDTDMKELKDIYMGSLSYFLHGFEKENPIYNDILNRTSLGVLLNISDDNFKQLVDYLNSAAFFLVRRFYVLRCLFGALYVDMRFFGASWVLPRHEIPHPNQWGSMKNHKEMLLIQGILQSSMLCLYTGSERSAFLFSPILPAR